MLVYVQNMPLKSANFLGKSSCVSKIPPALRKNRRITVSVTLQLTALFLKSFRIRLHCYTFFLSFFGFEDPINHWTKRMMNTPLTT